MTNTLAKLMLPVDKGASAAKKAKQVTWDLSEDGVLKEADVTRQRAEVEEKKDRKDQVNAVSEAIDEYLVAAYLLPTP